MDQNNKQALLEYLSPTKKEKVTFIVISILFVIAGLTNAIRAREGQFGIFLLFLGIAAAVSSPLVWKLYSLRRRIGEIEVNGQLPLTVKEFTEGKPMLDDALRLGKSMMFGRGMGTIVEYRELNRVYQYIHRTNGVLDRRALKVRFTDDSERYLCTLPRRRPDNAELLAVLAIIQASNPSVHFGFEPKYS